MIYRIAIANVPEADLARDLQERGFSATLTRGQGVGSWGREPTTVIEVASSLNGIGNLLNSWVRDILRAASEESAYVTRADTTGTVAYLWHATGKVEVIG